MGRGVLQSCKISIVEAVTTCATFQQDGTSGSLLGRMRSSRGSSRGSRRLCHYSRHLPHCDRQALQKTLSCFTTTLTTLRPHSVDQGVCQRGVGTAGGFVQLGDPCLNTLGSSLSYSSKRWWLAHAFQRGTHQTKDSQAEFDGLDHSTLVRARSTRCQKQPAPYHNCTGCAPAGAAACTGSVAGTESGSACCCWLHNCPDNLDK